MLGSCESWQGEVIEVVREGDQSTVVPSVGDVVLCKVRALLGGVEHRSR